MGTSIGTIAAALPLRGIETAGRRERGGASLRDETQPRLGRREEEPPPIRAGFGEGSLSPSGAALLTVGRTLERARAIVPSVEELRAEAAARSAEFQAEQAERTRRAGEARARGDAAEAEELERSAARSAPQPQAEFREVERFRPEAAPQARAFANESEATPDNEDDVPAGTRLDVLA